VNIDEVNAISARIGFADKFVALLREELTPEVGKSDEMLLALAGKVLALLVEPE
jgi:hypothetical protein